MHSIVTENKRKFRTAQWIKIRNTPTKNLFHTIGANETGQPKMSHPPKSGRNACPSQSVHGIAFRSNEQVSTPGPSQVTFLNPEPHTSRTFPKHSVPSQPPPDRRSHNTAKILPAFHHFSRNY
jgi:hypothetical protein